MTQPITPSQVGATKATVLPSKVIRAFNELIAAHCINGQAVVKQEDAVKRIMVLLERPDNLYIRQLIIDSGYLNVEDLYRSAGWDVVYDKSGYGEAYYPATFTFTKR